MRTRASMPATSYGFTLVEMTLVIALTGIVFVIGGLVMGRAFESYDLTRTTTNADWQGRVALERMVRELREIRTATAADLVFSGTQVRFIDADGNGVCFRLVGTTLQRSADGPASVCGTTTPQPLADNVATNGLSFFYYDNAGAVTAVAANVYYIAVTLQISQGTITETFRAAVQPRRF
jgi:prepilin-type N-terminal cleavage/methylation domain-containing protein